MCGLEANDYTISSLVFLSLQFSICTSNISRALEPLKRQVFVAQSLPNNILDLLGLIVLEPRTQSRAQTFRHHRPCIRLLEAPH
jgi:hypothetical protein